MLKQTISLAIGFAVLLGIMPFASVDAGPLDGDAVPQVNNKARDNLSGRYARADRHKAFVIGPAGRWQWRSEKSSPEEAVEAALERCNRKVKPHRCLPYAINDEVVLDHQEWAAILSPYPTAADAASASTGSGYGQRMYDLAFKMPDGQPRKLSDFKGKVVILHIWGSWCPPCKWEMPSLNKFYKQVKDNPDLVFIPISVKETYETGKSWADGWGYELPYVDGDAPGDELTLANGKTVYRQDIADYVPATFFLDRNGLVVFRKVKAFQRWEDFKPQIEHLIAQGAP